MEAKLYYRYSRMGKLHQFALITPHVWIWFYLGATLGERKCIITPYLPSVKGYRLVKHYKYNGCREIAEWIAKRIETKIK